MNIYYSFAIKYSYFIYCTRISSYPIVTESYQSHVPPPPNDRMKKDTCEDITFTYFCWQAVMTVMHLSTRSEADANL